MRTEEELKAEIQRLFDKADKGDGSEYFNGAKHTLITLTDFVDVTPLFNAEEKGIIDEIILALKTFGKEKMISYDREIEFLKRIRGLNHDK